MRLRSVSCVIFPLSAWISVSSYAQISVFPYIQNFDSVAQPALPTRWSSSQNRSPGANDFTTAGTPRSSPNAALSTNATIGQSLFSPMFDFRGLSPDRLSFYTRRSATHLARVVVEASADSGHTFSLPVGDTLTNTSPNNYILASFLIPSTLANRNGVAFRWRIIPDPGGNTGTFRIDDVIVTAQITYDLAMAGLRFVPAFANEGDVVQAIARVKNVGLQQAASFQVSFSIDLNNDSIPQPAELITTASHQQPLLAGDSLEISASLGTYPPGSKCVMAQVISAQDQNPSNDLMRGVLRVGLRPQSVVVNEIMYAPTGTEPEWVELYNTLADSVDVKDWLVSDNNVTTRKLIASSHVTIPSSGYLVMTKDSAALADIHPLIPSRVVTVSGFPTLNNTGDAVVVYDDRGPPGPRLGDLVIEAQNISKGYDDRLLIDNVSFRVPAGAIVVKSLRVATVGL